MHQPLPIPHKIRMRHINREIIHRLRVNHEADGVNRPRFTISTVDLITHNQLASRYPLTFTHIKGMFRRRLNYFPIKISSTAQ
ncbi:MAG TPA: hypothetical protein VLL52_00065 [Anaerolineae bacterium]|nr:hypothetical protein [Anaerolineae bacterium]